MEYFLYLLLTIVFVLGIIVIITKKYNRLFNKKVYRQSDMHNMLKIFFNRDIGSKKTFSQFEKRKEKNITKVVILGDKAYWVIDNTFYVGSAVNGEAKPETGVPLDTTRLSKLDIDKLLFILDSLKGGKTNDSGSTGN